jgi:hypothetical protein
VRGPTAKTGLESPPRLQLAPLRSEAGKGHILHVKIGFFVLGLIACLLVSALSLVEFLVVLARAVGARSQENLGSDLEQTLPTPQALFQIVA